MKGKLYLIPVTLGDSNVSDVIPEKVVQIINTIDHYIVEDERSARRFLKKAGIVKAIQDLTFFPLDKHASSAPKGFFPLLDQGKHIGLLSEAGCPGVADPGSDIVKMAHIKGICVVPLTGPSSIVLALMASGLNGQNFAFRGYIPVPKHERLKKIKDLESISARENQTQIFIETPYRNRYLLEDILAATSPSTKLCIACDLTLETEFVQTKTIQEWAKNIPDIHKRPTIFLLHR
ncbi:MAG: SAM-dependent methyltransferase [Candidatus Brocadiae bacterium]|nr:SAM-dependent methyltransferase [Candidatus Brocadiia bacterium]